MADKLSPELERLVSNMDVPNDIRGDADDVISSVIASSPYLQRRLLEQVKDGELEKIRIGHSEDTWGFFKDDGKTAVIDTELFKDFKSNQGRLEDALTYVLGHEVGHSNIGFEREQAKKALDGDMKRAYWTADRDSDLVDVTPHIQKFVRFSGSDETRSEIEGWNALASRIEQQKDAPPTAQEILDRAQYVSSFVKVNDNNVSVPVDGVSLKDGPYLTYFNPDMETVSANANAVSGVHFTPQLQARYAAYAVGVANAWSKAYEGPDPYETGINFKDLGLTPKQIEAAGLHLGENGGTFAVTDISHGGRNWVTLKQTRTDKSLEPHLVPDEPVQVAQQVQPGQKLFDQVLLAINDSTTLRAGSLSEQEKKQAAMGLALEALRSEPPLTRIDHVAIGKGENPNFFAVQGDLTDPAHLRAHLPASEAINTNMDQGMDQLNQLVQQRTQEQQLARELEQTQAQNNPALRIGGP